MSRLTKQVALRQLANADESDNTSENKRDTPIIDSVHDDTPFFGHGYQDDERETLEFKSDDGSSSDENDLGEADAQTLLGTRTIWQMIDETT